mgnify:CR=1 FL=1
MNTTKNKKDTIRRKSDAEAGLMRAAHEFAAAFSETASFGGSRKRLEQTIEKWNALALAAVDYAESVDQ